MLMGKNEKNNPKEEFVFVEDSYSGDKYHFTMKGQVSMRESSHIEFKLEQSVLAGARNIVVNMCCVKSFSSAGIRVLLAMYKKLKKMGGSLKIENPSENVRNVIGMVALDELLLK